MAAVSVKNSTLFGDANLVSLWELDGNSNDSKGSNNGSDTSVTYSADNGKFVQGAGYAAASSSKTVITDHASLKPTGNFSVLLWFKTSTTGTNKMLYQSFSLNPNRAGFYIIIAASNELQFVSGKNSGAVENTDWARVSNAGATSVCDGNWHMLVCTWDGTNLNLYLDNAAAQQTSWANAPSYAATNYIRLGCDNNSGTDQLFHDGTLDDIAFFSRALTSTEVSNHFSGADIALSRKVSGMTTNSKFW